MSEKSSRTRNEQPIRLFESNFLEFFTHISPITVLVLWLPVVAFFIYQSWTSRPGFPYYLPLGLILGLFLWTFAEYLLHRFVFHFHAKKPWQEKLTFIFHGIHHEQPRVKSRLVMPPAASIPLAMVFYGLFYVVFSFVLMIPNWLPSVFAGFILGYIAYDMLHYGTHHFPIKRGYLRLVRQHHMHHHFQTPDMRYGVSSPVWDYVFGTMPKEETKS
jgi:sterol desaturase/sphingolipid hydroxylase (fatty acid hydroxylase superfamily)